LNAELSRPADERDGRWSRPVLLAVAISPIALAFYLMCTHWVPLPYWDPWHTPAAQIASWCRGTLTFAELFSQHNEHRPLFPRLVIVPMAAAFGWDVRREMALGFVLLCIGAAALYVLLRHSVAPRHARLLGFGLINLLVFTPRQSDNLVSGTEGGSFLPTVALLCALAMNLSSRSMGVKTITNAALSLVSTFTFGNGMLLWVFAFPIASAARAESLRWRAAYVLAAVASIGAYFVGYRHPPLAPPPAQSLSDIPAMLHFLARWMGSPFLTDTPTAIGAIALAIFCLLAATALALTLRTGDWRKHYAWLVLGAYVAASGAITARARLGFGLEMASDWRYTAFNVFFHVAAVGLGLSVWQQLVDRAPSIRRALTGCVAACAIAIVALSVFAFGKQRVALQAFKAKREHLREVVRRSLVDPADPELPLLSPYPATAETIRTLHECGVLWPIVR
jgi:hypothetical protein